MPGLKKYKCVLATSTWRGVAEGGDGDNRCENLDATVCEASRRRRSCATVGSFETPLRCSLRLEERNERIGRVVRVEGEGERPRLDQLKRLGTHEGGESLAACTVLLARIDSFVPS